MKKTKRKLTERKMKKIGNVFILIFIISMMLSCARHFDEPIKITYKFDDFGGRTHYVYCTTYEIEEDKGKMWFKFKDGSEKTVHFKDRLDFVEIEKIKGSGSIEPKSEPVVEEKKNSFLN